MTSTVLPPRYTPENDRRRRDRVRAFVRDLKLRDVLLAIAAIVLALGWTFSSPAKQIAQLQAADSAQDRRIGTNEKAIASLAEQQRFTNWMLCMNARRTDPASAPPDCIPIIEARKPK